MTAAARSGVDVVADLVARLALAVHALQLSVDACDGCGGRGELRERLDAFLLSDCVKPRAHGYAAHRLRTQIERFGPRVLSAPAGSGVLRTPCPDCRKARQIIEIAKGVK